MKKSILFLALLLSFLFACNKGPEFQTAGQTIPGTPNANSTKDQAGERAICCCNVVVATTYFGGLTICGVSSGTTACNPCPFSCAPGCGFEQVVPSGNKNANFCYETECTICFTNTGTQAIQIYLSCPGGNSGLIPLNAGETKCYLSDCTGALTPCGHC